MHFREIRAELAQVRVLRPNARRTTEVPTQVAILFSTVDVSQRDRFAYWREAVCDSYVPLECSSEMPERFHGSIKLHRLSKISASYVGGGQQHVRRRKRDIARATDASFLVSVQLKGNTLIEQDGRQAYLRPGDFALYSSIEPYDLHPPEGFEQLVLQIPREELLARLPNADVLTGRRVSGSGQIGGLASATLSSLVGAIEHTNATVLSCMQDTICDLVATGLASLVETPIALSKPEQQILIRARAFLADNLRDPTLDREMLAAAMGMSVRRLSEIFRHEGAGIAETIREMRLIRIAAEMRDARYRRLTIGEIAFKWGIGNLSQFSRGFRTRFDQTPSEYRKQVTQGERT